jgi:hypothetical protein
VWVREGKALFCLRPDNPLRVRVWDTVRSNSFESFVLGLIIANCVLLALDNPGVEDGSVLRQVGNLSAHHARESDVVVLASKLDAGRMIAGMLCAGTG